MAPFSIPDPLRFLPDITRRLISGGGQPAPALEDEWSLLTRSQQLQALGAEEAEVERARRYEALEGPTGIGRIAPELGVETPTARRGLLEMFFDASTRLQSASTGALSGLAGLERSRVTRTASGESDGALIARPEPVANRVATALERFAQGLSGEEKFQAADFGALAYDRETASTAERFLKSSVGFVLDTAADPITYLSLGGSVLGRKGASVAVNSVARKNADKLIDGMEPLAQRNLVRDGIQRNGIKDQQIRAQIQEMVDNGIIDGAFIPKRGLSNLGTDELLDIFEAASPNGLAGIAADTFAYTAANAYTAGPGAFYRYITSFEGGKEFWRKSIPNDIKGGVRFRVPFSSMASRVAGGEGVPLALRVPGTGTGKIAGALQLDDLSNAGRKWVRSRSLFRSKSGRTGDDYADMANETLKRDKALAADLFGKVEPSGAMSYGQWMARDDGLRMMRLGSMGIMREVLPDLKKVQRTYRAGMALKDADFEGALSQASKFDVADIIQGKPLASIDEVFGLSPGQLPTEAQQLAFDATQASQTIFAVTRARLDQLRDTSLGFDPKYIEQSYMARIIDDVEKTLSGKVNRGITNNLRERAHFIAELHEDGTVKRFMTAREIKDQIGESYFTEDLRKVMTAYVSAMDRFIGREAFLQHQIRNGVLSRGGSETVQQTLKDVTISAERFVKLANDLAARKSRVEGLIGEEPLDAAARSGRALRDEFANAREVSEALALADAHGLKLMEQYRPAGVGRFVAPDGTTVRELTFEGQQRYAVSSPIGRDGADQFLGRTSTGARRFVNDPDGSEYFKTLQEAKNAANAARSTARQREFVRVTEGMREEFERDLVRALKLKDTLRLDENTNVLSPGLIPPARQDEYFEAFSEMINKYGSSEGLLSRKSSGEVYRQPRFEAGVGGLQRRLADGATDGRELSEYWMGRMAEANIFAPESIADDVVRMFSAVQKPEGFIKRVDDYYKPFYAMQKALMTSQRGPGYVLRNMQGGMWNAYLVGTGLKHWRLAGIAKVAEFQARKRAEDMATDESVVKYLAREEFRKILTQRLGPQRGLRVFEAWEAFERRGMRGSTNLSRELGTQSVAGADESIDSLRLGLDADNWVQKTTRAVREDWWWARTMTSAAQGSEDYLRFGVFLRGVDLYGLDDGGRAAGMLVRGTQFDYSDLSVQEAEFLKMIVPFYTWTRNNVPLQLRAIINEPGKVNKALRINNALADAFGEPEDPEEPLPQYVRERFGWRVRPDVLTGPMGDALSAGVVIGEPLTDVNRLFGSGTAAGPLAGPASMLNWRELANQMNPVFGVGSELLTGIERSTGAAMPREEEAPPWARFLARRTPEGERVISSRGLRVAREILPPLGMIERYAAPLVGNERMQRRWYTSLASAVLGLPVSTLDPYQTGAELRAREQRVRGGLERALGEEYVEHASFVRRALGMGVTPEEMNFIRNGLFGGRELKDVPVAELDQWRMVDTINFGRRMDRLLANGVPQETVDLMWSYFTPRTDVEQGIRAGKAKPLSENQLRELGTNSYEVSKMTPEEHLDLVRRYQMLNPEWSP
jgi:hypothetical protein